MSELKTHALISTEFSEEPDLILSFDKENNVLKWIPFSTEEGITSFHISRGSMIIPIKYVAQAEGPIKQQRVVIGADYGEGLLRQAAVTQDSDTRMFQIINNSNCVFKVELSALGGLSSSQIREKGAHCVYPWDGDGSFIEKKLIALLPETFDTTSHGIKKYSMKVLDIDKMYGNNVLNFSGYWVDILDDPISAITGTNMKLRMKGNNNKLDCIVDFSAPLG